MRAPSACGVVGLAFFSCIFFFMDVMMTECPVADDFFFSCSLENGPHSAEAREFRSTLLRAPGMTVGDERA